MKQIAEDGIQTENDLVDIPQKKGYSKDFDLWKMEYRLQSVEAELSVLRKRVCDLLAEQRTKDDLGI